MEKNNNGNNKQSIIKQILKDPRTKTGLIMLISGLIIVFVTSMFFNGGATNIIELIGCFISMSGTISITKVMTEISAENQSAENKPK